MKLDLKYFTVLALFFLIFNCESSDDSPEPDTNTPISGLIVSTFAGSTNGFADGTGVNAKFSYPGSITLNTDGNFYVTDLLNHRIRKITPEGVVSTFVGGVNGFADGNGINAQLNRPAGICNDLNGNLYFIDNEKIRKITPQGDVTTIAGSTNGFADGSGANAKFNFPNGICIDANENLYIADSFNFRIRKITPQGQVTTLAGSTDGFTDGNGSVAQFDSPLGITIDADGNLYVTDAANDAIRKITPQGVVSTIAGGTNGSLDGFGTDAEFRFPEGIEIDSNNNLYITDAGNDRLRKITPQGEVISLVGSIGGSTDGIAQIAKFKYPQDVCIDANGDLYVVEKNHRVRKVTLN